MDENERARRLSAPGHVPVDDREWVELADMRQMLVLDENDWGHDTFAATWHPQ